MIKAALNDRCRSCKGAMELLEPLEQRALLAFQFSEGPATNSPGLSTYDPSVTTNSVAADFDGDGKADLAISGAQRLGFLKGNGDGTFAAPVWINLQSRTGTLALADDGKGEFAVFAVGGINPSTFESGTFRTALVRRFEFSADTGGFVKTGQVALRYATTTQVLRESIGTVVSGQITGDSHADLVVPFLSLGPALIRTRTDGTLVVGRYFGSSINLAGDRLDVSLADISGDGRNDVIVQTTRGSFYAPNPVILPYAFVTNAGGLSRTPVTLTALGSTPWRFADVNADGIVDAVGVIRTSPLTGNSVPLTATFDVRVRLGVASAPGVASTFAAEQSGGTFSLGQGSGSIDNSNPAAESATDSFTFRLVSGQDLGASSGVGVFVQRTLDFTSRSSSENFTRVDVGVLPSISVAAPQAGTLAYTDIVQGVFSTPTPANGGVRLNSPFVDLNGDGLIDSARIDFGGVQSFLGTVPAGF